VTRASATLGFIGPDLKANSNLTVQIYAKDALVWPFAVVLLATWISSRTHRWIQSGRSESTNLAEMTLIADDLYNLGTMRDGAIDDPRYHEIQQLLATATRRQQLGDLSGSAATLADARKKLDALIAGVPPPAATKAVGPPPPPAVVIETPEAERTTGRKLAFSVHGAVPPDVVWEISREGQWVTLDVAVDASAAAGSRHVTRVPVRPAGLYAVRLVAGGVPGQPATFRVEPSPAERIARNIQRTDRSIELLAAVLTTIVTGAAIWELDSFGTFRDYALQFAGAFGFTEAVKGFAQTLAAVRKTS
jgi:hypothetical protein